MTDYIVTRADESELEHHGVKGQKWGVRKKRVSIRSGAKKAASSIKKVNAAKRKAKKVNAAKRASMSTKQKVLSNAGKFAVSSAVSAALVSVAFHQSPVKTLKMYAGVYAGLGRMGSAAAKMAASKGGAILKEAGYRAANPGFKHLSAAESAAARAATNGVRRLK